MVNRQFSRVSREFFECVPRVPRFCGHPDIAFSIGRQNTPTIIKTKQENVLFHGHYIFITICWEGGFFHIPLV